MGNSASVMEGMDEVDMARAPLGALERLAEEGFFMTHPQVYKDAVEAFVRLSRLDALEVVVPAGRVKSVVPLHLAAKYGQIDCVELFASAGFNPLVVDSEGKTPLHWSATNRSSESALCATFLALAAPAAHAIRDKDGNNPLHLACKRNNEKVFAALLAHGANVKTPDAHGKNCRQIAKIKQLSPILSVLDGTGTKNMAAGTPSSSSSRGRKAKSGEGLDMERTMQVWERFFENAFKAMGAEIDEFSGVGMDSGEGFLLDVGGMEAALRGAKATSAFDLLEQEGGFFEEDVRGREAAVPNGSDWGSGGARSSFGSVSADKSKKETVVDPRVSSWLDWVLCYSASANNYYVVHRQSYQSEWLEIHLERERKHHGLFSGMHHVSVSDTSSSSGFFSSNLPTSVLDLVRAGWMSFFDDKTNSAYWMHLSGQCELVVPVGAFDNTMHSLGFEAWEDSAEWVRADQSPCSQWCIVTLGDDDPRNSSTSSSPAQMWFFTNIMTGHSNWGEPDGWASQVEAMGGWALCRHEDDANYYWWNTHTGDTSWA